MDLNYSPEELAFRDEVRGWLRANLPADLRQKMESYQELSKEELLRWHKILAKKGWVAPDWPAEWGGTDWNVVQRYIFEEECGFAATPMIVPFGVRMCAPVLLQFGTEAQKKRFLPRIYQGEDFWCQGYSEPGSGSDLASLKTRAVRQDGGHYVVTGQKIWTTMAQHADWIFCLVRTDASGKRQDGISFLLIDMKSPGITVRPIVLLDGSKEVNEVFFDEVRVPAENLVHEEGKGWTVAKYLLGYERMGTGRIGASKRELAKLKELAGEQMKDGRPIIEDPRFRDRLTRVEVELMALEITNLRFLDQMRRSGRPPGADVSMLKIKGTEIQQTLTELMMQAVGPLAQPFKPTNGSSDFDDFTAGLAPRYCNFRK
ncbi:MAG TPA: acyl-CoA dehydrogenase family protein, partial [Methylomirabilota bacterium]|nr:acyl-CoA dehydrogenase family protein [Methylomirabilota bacterium]